MKSANSARSATMPGRAKPLGAYPHWKRIGEWIYISGTSARQADDSIRGSDIASQTRGVVENLRAILADAGATLDDLVDVTVFLVDMADFSAYNEAYAEYFGPDGPTRTTVAVRALPRPDLLIEIKAVAHHAD